MAVVFFYGLFMDAGRLQQRGVPVKKQMRGRVDGYRLVISARATLVPEAGQSAHGMLMELSSSDLERLYSDSSVNEYRPETLCAITDDGRRLDAVCYNLPQPLAPAELNREYAQQLFELGARLGLPQSYLDSIAQVACVLR